MDKAGKEYWDDLWLDADLPEAVNPDKEGLNNYVNREFHGYFKQHIGNHNEKKMELLEIGCAGSAWLPYFAKEFSCYVTGIDYSETGCRMA